MGAWRSAVQGLAGGSAPPRHAEVTLKVTLKPPLLSCLHCHREVSISSECILLVFPAFILAYLYVERERAI
jgi:hypothetical protein